MAGKADLVNSIADSLSVQSVPLRDGWDRDGAPDAPYGPGNAAPGGSLALDPLGGAG